MSIAAPPRPAAERAGPFSRSKFLGFIDISRATHFLKLRQDWKASDKFKIELGADFDVTNNFTRPWAGIRLQLHGDGSAGWAVEVNTDWCVVCTPKVDLIPFTDRLSLPVDLRVGKDFYNNDSLHLEAGIHNTKASLLLLGLALASRKPIHIKRKEVGVFSFGLPMRLKNGKTIPYTAQPGMELDTTLERKDGGLRLDFHQLNAVIRLRQD